MVRIPAALMRVVIRFGLVALVALALAGCADEGIYSITFVSSDGHAVRSGETLPGDVLVLDGGLIVEPGGEIGRHLFVLGGEVRVAGEIGGDVSALGGQVRIEDSARVGGDMNYSAGEVEIAPGAEIDGESRESFGIEVPLSAGWQEASWRNRVGWVVASTLLMALVAGLLALLVPRPVTRIGEAATAYPVPAGALGLISLVTAVVLIVFMAFTVVLLPVSMLLLVAGVGLIVFGLAGAGLAAGGMLARWRCWSLGMVSRAMIGTGALVLALHLIQIVPLVGWVVPALVVSVATGATLLTRLGMRVFQPETIDQDEPASSALESS
jgi:hypothetical protein